MRAAGERRVQGKARATPFGHSKQGACNAAVRPSLPRPFGLSPRKSACGAATRRCGI